MSENIPQNFEVCNTEGDSKDIHSFHTIPPDLRGSVSQKVEIIESDARIYKKINESVIEPKEKKMKQLTIIDTTFMLTNFCLGTTIFAFAIRAKNFGLFWIIVFCILVGIINYWTIMRSAIASFKYRENADYSDITLLILGKKARFIANIFIILYTYACIMCFLALLFPLCGRFVQTIFFNNKYDTYEEFEQKKWGTNFIKFPFFVVLTFFTTIMCLTNKIKLTYLPHIRIIIVFYTLFVIMVQSKDFYNYYKNTIYKKEDKNTHPNWFNLGKAFTKDLEFFKGMSNLFCAYACLPRIFPVINEFKTQKNGIKKIKLGVLFSICLTTSLHIISIVCSFLTEPCNPEDLIIFRKKKGNGKDIAITISQLSISVSLIFTIPGYYFNLRKNIVNSFNKGVLTDKFNYIFTLSSCLGCSIIAAFYGRVLNYLTYIGGFISVFICYLNPILMYVFSTEKKLKDWKNIVEIVLIVFICIIGVIAGIATIIDDVKK